MYSHNNLYTNSTSFELKQHLLHLKHIWGLDLMQEYENNFKEEIALFVLSKMSLIFLVSSFIFFNILSHIVSFCITRKINFLIRIDTLLCRMFLL